MERIKPAPTKSARTAAHAALSGLLLLSAVTACARGTDLPDDPSADPTDDRAAGSTEDVDAGAGSGEGRSGDLAAGGSVSSHDEPGAGGSAAGAGGSPAGAGGTDPGSEPAPPLGGAGPTVEPPAGGNTGLGGSPGGGEGGAPVLEPPSTEPLGGDPGPTWKVLSIDYEIQQTGYWCGPAATHNALSARISAPSQAALAGELPTTVNGTDWIGQITSVLNRHLGAARYKTVEMPNDPPTQAQRDQLWRDVVRSVDNNYPIVANIVAPPSNHPPGYPNDQTIYHYLAVIGYNSDTSEVYLADSANFGGNQLYWISFGQLATLIPPKGYSAYQCPTDMTTGEIDRKYQALGGCDSVVGGAVSGETATPDGVGRYNVFERGSIYWTAATGAHAVHGAIRDAWRDRGWEGGELGYPITDEYPVPGGKRSDFQGGSLTWYSSTGSVVFEP